MSMMRYLFVGGPWDGQQHETDRKVVEVPDMVPILPGEHRRGEQAEQPQCRTVMYREHHICGVPFMVPTTMSTKDAVVKLSRSYHERLIYRQASEKLKAAPL